MPIAKKWSPYNKETINAFETDNLGIYEIGHRETGEILYIGEGQVRIRLLAHMPDGKRNHETVVGGNVYRTEYTGGKTKAVQRQNSELDTFRIKNGDRNPKYNKHRRTGY